MVSWWDDSDNCYRRHLRLACFFHRLGDRPPLSGRGAKPGFGADYDASWFLLFYSTSSLIMISPVFSLVYLPVAYLDGWGYQLLRLSQNPKQSSERVGARNMRLVEITTIIIAQALVEFELLPAPQIGGQRL